MKMLLPALLLPGAAVAPAAPLGRPWNAMDDRAFADDRDAAPPLIKSFAGSNSPGRQSHSDAA